MATHTDQKLELLKRTPLLSELGGHELEEVGELQLKGFSRPIETVNVVGVRAGGRPIAAAAGGDFMAERA